MSSSEKSSHKGHHHKSKKSKEFERLRALSIDELNSEYRQKAQEVWDVTWDLIEDSTEWKCEVPGGTLNTGSIHSKHFEKLGKVFKLEAYVDVSPQFLFEETVPKVNESIHWNPTLVECRTLQIIDDCTDISYNATTSAAGGLVASRDFVNLRHWKWKNGIMLSSGCAVLHPDMPPSKKHVRGENKAGGWFLKPVSGHPDKCIFGWIICTDLKGWLPQYLVDQATSDMLLEFLGNLRQYIYGLNSEKAAT